MQQPPKKPQSSKIPPKGPKAQQPSRAPRPPIKKPQTGAPGEPIKVEKEDVKNFLVDYFETSKAIILSPNDFFNHMPREGGLIGPSIFLAVSTAMFSAIHIVTTHTLLQPIGEFVLTMFLILGMARGLEYMLKQFGGKGNFEETYRVLCYCSPPLILMGFDILQPFALLYMAVLWFLGLKKVHDFTL